MDPARINPGRSPRWGGGATILTLLTMVACFAAVAESHASERREARIGRVVLCACPGSGLIVVAEGVAARSAPSARRASAAGVETPPAEVAGPASPLRPALLDLPPPSM